MQPPKFPDNEQQRLQVLQQLNILDTPAEERFDRVTRLAKQMFNVPIVLVSLIDSDRQWFKSRQGLDACETGRDISFCGHAIHERDIFEVNDASQDIRFADNPLVTDAPNIRFYAGAPMITEDGYALGTLCLIDSQPRELSHDERQALWDLANIVLSELFHLERNRQKQEVASARQVAEIIARSQLYFIQEEKRSKAFDNLLNDILKLTESEYGFIGEVLYDTDGSPYLKTYAITNIAWNDETRAFYEEKAPKGMEFLNLKSLFGSVLTSGEAVIANDPYHDPRRGGLPEGHPALNAFLGIPVYQGNRMVAMLGVANRAGGYDRNLVDSLSSLLATIGQLVVAAQLQQQHLDDQKELSRLSIVASQTTNGVIITNQDGFVVWINEGFTRISGYTLDDMKGQKPGKVLQGVDSDVETIARISAALTKKEKFEEDIVNYDRRGKPYWVRIQCNPFYDKSGQFKGFMAIESDITSEKENAKRLQKSEQRLTSVIEGTDIGTWEWNIQTGETIYNKRWADIVGYTIDELAASSQETFHKLLHPDDLEHIKQQEKNQFDGNIIAYDCRMRHKAGHWVWVHSRGRLVDWTEDGKPLLMIGTHADITEAKQAENALKASEARLRSFFEMSPIGIALNDYETGVFVDFNEALLRPTGYSREEFISISYLTLTPSKYEVQEKQKLAELREKGRYGPYEKEYIRKDGSRYPVQLSGIVVFDNNGRKLIWSIIEDISERKRVEQIKNDFISTVSHELRTPLTSITGALGLLLGGVVGELSSKVQGMLEIAQNNSRRLGFLINDLLDIEKLLAGKMTFDMEVQPLQPLLQQAIRDNQPYAERFDVHLRLISGNKEALVEVDTVRFNQILSNLLSNAAKFSPKDSEVTVSFSCQNNRVRVFVSDVGPGIPKEFSKNIFQKFSQVDSSNTRKIGGTGLGLAISQELALCMGGTIDFESLVGIGTTFYVEFPLIAGGKPWTTG
ncbi:PAS domain S-box protein [Colwelliaceae bacterium 6471]